jgi:hypothetical protein
MRRHAVRSTVLKLLNMNANKKLHGIKICFLQHVTSSRKKAKRNRIRVSPVLKDTVRYF